MSRAKKSTTDHNKGLYADYLKFQHELEEKLGTKNCVCLYTCGSFLETYQKSEDFMKRFCGILNIAYSKRNGKDDPSSTPLLMAGWPICSNEKHISALLDNGITCGLVEQFDMYNTNKKTRKLTKIYTPETTIENYSPTSEKFFHCLYLEPNESKRFGFKILTGLSSLDISTGANEIQEFSFKSYEEVNEKICELQLSSVKVEVFCNVDISNFIESAKVIDISLTSAYIDSVLTKVFGGGNTPIQHRLNLTFFDTSIKALTLNLNNIYKINPDLLRDISEPKYKQFDTKVTINSTFLSDVHILPNDKSIINKSDELFGITEKKSAGTVTSILGIFDKCITNSGSRQIRRKLLEPTFDIEILNDSYEKINGMLDNNLFVKIRENLKNINDPERNLRRLQINVDKSSLVHVKSLFDVLISGQDLLEIVKNTIFSDICPVNINEILKMFNEVIDLNASNGEPFIKPKFCETFDKTVEKSKNVKETVENLQVKFSEIIKAPNSFKIETVGASDDKNYQAKCTSKRSEVLKNSKLIIQITDTFQVTPSNLTYKLSNSKKDCVVSGEPLDKLLYSYKHLNNEYEKQQQLALNKFVKELLGTYANELKIINKFICELDVYASIAKVSNENAYYCPTIDSDINGFIVKDLRHPIVEKNNGSYVANDVDYASDSKPKLCTSLNSSGKSLMGKSITTALYLSQCGFFISANIKLNPFHKLLTRINGDDILTSNLSSFDRELTDLKYVLNQLDNKTFLFADELSKGSEQSAILCINSALIETVVEKGSYLYLTTHCHEIKKIKEVRDTSRFYHMETEYLDDEIVFKRKFIEGEGESRYGLKCATSILGKESDFMAKCKKFEKSYVDEKKSDNITDDKKSHYNSKVFVEKCEICGKTSKDNTLDTHHILEQYTFDSNKLNGHIKKDNVDNLVVLCKKCHLAVDDPTKLIIRGWKHTSKGRVLDYQLFE